MCIYVVCIGTPQKSGDGSIVMNINRNDILRDTEEEQGRQLSQCSTEEHNAQLINSMSLIEWDLPRTYPTLG